MRDRNGRSECTNEHEKKINFFNSIQNSATLKTNSAILIPKILLWLVLIGIANGMLNTPDIEQRLQKVEYNELESIAEWFLEDLMEWDEAMPEQDLPEQDQKKGAPLVDWIASNPGTAEYIVFYSSREYSQQLYRNRPDPALEITSPPPDC